MKKYMIEVVPKFEKNPTNEEFENIRDSIVDAVDNYCNNQQRSFHVTYPYQKDIDEGRFIYHIHILIKSEKELSSAALFELLNLVDKHPLVMVTVQESRFCKRDTPIFWYHEGETTYYDGTTYISPSYDLYVNKQCEYTVQNVSLWLRSHPAADKKTYQGVSYMWSSTNSWNNFLKATTLDEALKEFEEYYYKQLWKAVESTRKRLDEATDELAQFADYRCREGSVDSRRK